MSKAAKAPLSPRAQELLASINFVEVKEALDYLRELETSLSLRFSREGDQLRVGPRENVTNDIARAIRENRDFLIGLVGLRDELKALVKAQRAKTP